MDRRSFEDSLKAKFEGGKITPPKRVWDSINANLNEQAVAGYRKSRTRYQLAAAAAVLFALISFAINIELNQESSSGASSSYNALLPSSSDHFRFYEPKTTVTKPDYRQSWSRIMFVDRETKQEKAPKVTIEPIEDDRELFLTLEVDRLYPEVYMASVKDQEVSPYYVAQYRRAGRSKNKSQSTYWAGVTASTGNFTPEFNGSSPLSTSANFQNIANALGQNGFVNPSSTASQNTMEEGVMSSFGVDFGIKMGQKWTLESGVQYASMSNSSTASVNIIDVFTVNNPLLDGSDINNPSARQTEIENSVDHTIELENQMTFTSIPVKAGYFLVDKKMSLRLNAGLTANYFLSSQLNDPTGQLQNTNSNNLYNEWSFDGLTGLEFGYNIFNNFNLTVEPNYIQSITPLSSSLVNRTGFMVQTGLRYNIE